MTPAKHTDLLEGLYCDLNHRQYVHPDPLEFLYDYDDPGDRELVALVGSSLAYGRVKQILKSVSVVLDRLGPRPVRRLAEATPSQLQRDLGGFKHRFNNGGHVAGLLVGAKRVIERYGSLEKCFDKGLNPAEKTFLPALRLFAGRIIEAAQDKCGHLLPNPAAGSACKRLNLMLRWLVRQDEVDPGGWSCVGPEKLIIPLDTHMHKIGLAMGMTMRRSADIRTAMEITAGFRHISPNDPVKYDFALTRLGIRDDMDYHVFFAHCGADTKERAYA